MYYHYYTRWPVQKHHTSCPCPLYVWAVTVCLLHLFHLCQQLYMTRPKSLSLLIHYMFVTFLDFCIHLYPTNLLLVSDMATCDSSTTHRTDYFKEIRQLMLENSICSDSGCWIWKTRQNRDNGFYARVRHKELHGDSNQYYVHRLSYMGFHEMETIPNNLQVSHLCGTRRCVNPSHLVLEDRNTNKSRQSCHSRGWCGTHRPQCVFK